MLIRAAFLLILTLIKEIYTLIDQVVRKCIEDPYCFCVISGILFVSAAIVFLIILARKKFKSSGSNQQASTSNLFNQTNYQSDIIHPNIQEINSMNTTTVNKQAGDYSYNADDEEIIENDQTRNSDSGIGTISPSPLNLSVSPGTISRWQELIDEGEVLNRQLFDLAESKEWVRKKRLVWGNVATADGTAGMSPMTKHLFRRK